MGYIFLKYLLADFFRKLSAFRPFYKWNSAGAVKIR